MYDIKRELKNYNKLKEDLKALNKEMETLKEDEGKLYFSPIYGKIKTSKVNDQTCDQALKNIEKLKKLETKIKFIEFEINIIDKMIEMLPDEEKRTIKYKYIYKYNWAKICDLMGYSEKTGRRMINKSIKRFDFMLNKYGYMECFERVYSVE